MGTKNAPAADAARSAEKLVSVYCCAAHEPTDGVERAGEPHALVSQGSQAVRRLQGRARRREYWACSLITVAIAVTLGIIDLTTGFYHEATDLGLLSTLYGLGVMLPGLAVSARRLHDTGRTGWWLLLLLIPVLGALVLFVLMLLNSNPGDNPYGPNPKEMTAALVSAHGI